jgi:hypothetical protein
MNRGTLIRVAVTTGLLFGGWILSTLVVHPYLTSSVQAASEDVEVWVEGPWAYADDPRPGHDGIVLIAPNANSINHLPPAVSHAGGDSPVGSSIIAINNLTTPSPCPSPCTFHSSPDVPVDKNKLISLLNAPAGNYIISIPRPDYYEQAVTQSSRLRYGWWDECRPFNPPHTPTNKNCHNSSADDKFVTQMILHYSVTDLDGFTLDMKAYDFEDRRFIHIFMTPQGKMDPCDTDGRRAFGGLIGLFKLKSAEPLYIDLRSPNGPYASDDPPNAANCLDNDPQRPGHLSMAGSLTDSISYLEAYLISPAQGAPQRARDSFERIDWFRILLPREQQSIFDTRMNAVNSFLEKIEKVRTPDPSEQIKAVQDLIVAVTLINRHDGSGACRNPLLPLNPI